MMTETKGFSSCLVLIQPLYYTANTSLMKKCVFIAISILLGISLYILVAIPLPLPLEEKRLIVLSHAIPFLNPNPNAQIIRYVYIANKLFDVSLQYATIDPQKSIFFAYRAEHCMTLMVTQLRKITETDTISYSFLKGAFSLQSEMLESLREKSLQKKNIEQVISFAQRNKKTALVLYYNGLPSGKSVSQDWGNATR
jgi:hypothetical protein